MFPFSILFWTWTINILKSRYPIGFTCDPLQFNRENFPIKSLTLFLAAACETNLGMAVVPTLGSVNRTLVLSRKTNGFNFREKQESSTGAQPVEFFFFFSKSLLYSVTK